MNHRAAITAIFGIAGILLGAQAFAQALDGPSAPPSNAGAAPPANRPLPAAITENGDGSIIATVNDEPITKHDLDERMAMDLGMMGGRPTDEEKARLREQELAKLKTEVLHMQEARRKAITVSPIEIEKQIERIAQASNGTVENLAASMAGAGANLDTLRRKIQVDLAWQRTVEDEYQQRAATSVSQADVDAEVSRIAEGALKPHYHVREIVMAVDNPADDAKVKKDAEVIIEQIKQGGDFGNTARLKSDNPSAASGGDIGWVVEGQYAPELIVKLSEMKPGMMTLAPVKANGAYYILNLLEREEPAGTKIVESPTLAESKQTELPLAHILLPLGPKPSKEFIEGGMKAASDLRMSQPVCSADFKAYIQKMGGVYEDLGMFKLADISPEIQKALQPTRSGEAAEPLLSPAGVELILRCDPRQEVLTPFKVPTRDEVEYQIYLDRITTWARRYNRDLTRAADIVDVKAR